MFFIPLTILFIFFIILLLPVLFILLQIGLVSFAFENLGIPTEAAIIFYAVSLISSSFNIPVYKRDINTITPITQLPFESFIGSVPQLVKKQIVAVNVGGCIIPVIMSLIIAAGAPLIPIIISTIIVTLISYFAARPVTGVGIMMPFWVAPIASAIVASLFSPGNSASVAFVSGVFGILIGADILHLKDFLKANPGILSIGGAGVFDGIFLTGIVAAFLS